ncbi:urea carboxylase [Marinococcus halophilus]|uniref:Urea carboxylase n=1 Tax=Marinococcus halophilus TaxID=1371 RepID=A0A510Y505_MARHA|nr:urea carboxylase [Marinococcus halophilus]OZT80341.1 urea carboxylase [Marinococcus halophilus]GEK58400.1 urea carboxylase [Marinococcus halophilus]
MFQKVLIANRGAIAVRIERTLKKLNIPSVAVYTKADRDSLHVAYADEAVNIGEGAPQESYLNEQKILETALEKGADAIHPGYGFLSENADFARECAKQNITFIGPEPEQMELFGLKHTARAAAKEAGVPLLPGTDLLDSREEAMAEAAGIGYPVILKSTAGGGGIGMRICENEESLHEAYENVKHLAEANFNDGGMFLEKYIPSARHIEVQIFGNESGEVVALGERDCSLQRRNQKVVEETPAPNITEETRKAMWQAAERLAETSGYRSAGTVEFLYDPDECTFYFLEVNTRLQVEHGVTEEVLGIDLVEWMVKEAAGCWQNLAAKVPASSGHSIQARVYAEDCGRDFRPSAGHIDHVLLSNNARNETWIQNGVETTTLYDPMLAKIIVHAGSRETALDKLYEALGETRFYGVTTNRQYVRRLLQDSRVREGHVFTRLLNDFDPAEKALEVLDGGIQTTVQDVPGRTGHWDVGVPPCGPMDPFAFRLGNAILNNAEDASGLELTLQGGSYIFRDDLMFCITGSDMGAALEGEAVALYETVKAKKGQTLTFGKTTEGMRTYLLVEGGFDKPKVLGSSSTFTLGEFGGHAGRALRPGDILGVRGSSDSQKQQSLAADTRPELKSEWTIGMIPGPHCTPEFLQPEYLQQLAEAEWEVHFNSSRTGVRLIGSAPSWTREDGGEAGLHPSNIHDNAYAVGTLDLTGDMPILLGPDGPSLGGFVCPVTTASAEFWKIGQLQPGDKVHFQLLTIEQANDLRKTQERLIESVRAGRETEAITLPKENDVLDPDYPLLVNERQGRRFPITVRMSGDEYLLVEYGEMELDLKLRFQVQVLMEAIEKEGVLPVIEMTPGVRSLQIHIDPLQMTVQEASDHVLRIDENLPPLESIQVPSRIVKLPLSWNDPSVQLATERYQQNVRPDAPWCPDNLEFIRRINGLESIDDVKQIVFDANYLVLGLGDVYLGAPLATPTDPRHRLVTTKYNPARTWTPENAVGIGGAYMCVYGMEGPGGYQFVGRTIQMWNRLQATESFEPGKPWLLRFFDQIQYYPVSHEELTELREDFLRGRFEADITETTFDLGEYLAFQESIQESAAAFKENQQAAFQAERERWKEQGIAEHVEDDNGNAGAPEEELPTDETAVRCSMPGSVWKVEVTEGQYVKKGDVLVIEESMKMEFPQQAPEEGYVASIHVEPGDEVQAGQLIVGLRAEKESGVSVT